MRTSALNGVRTFCMCCINKYRNLILEHQWQREVQMRRHQLLINLLHRGPTQRYYTTDLWSLQDLMHGLQLPVGSCCR